MVRPNLIHPVPVEIEPLARAETIQDDGYDEPVQNVARPVRYTIPAQIAWKSEKQLRATALGADDGSDGYVLFRRVDLQRRGIDDINQGDRVVAMGAGPNRRLVDLYIIRIRPEGHYPDQRGGSLLKAFFRDRHPVHQQRGGP